MTKKDKIKIGDRVTWGGCPNELSYSRIGQIIEIHKGIAKITKDFSDKVRLVPINQLQKIK